MLQCVDCVDQCCLYVCVVQVYFQDWECLCDDECDECGDCECGDVFDLCGVVVIKQCVVVWIVCDFVVVQVWFM